MADKMPLSPHLSIWRWRISMATSIMHRITGNGLALVGTLIFAWWLIAAATSDAAYATFQAVAGSWIGWIVWVGLTWFAFQHLLSGLRHLVMDSGWGYSIPTSSRTGWAAWIGAVVLTIIFWALFFLTRPGVV